MNNELKCEIVRDLMPSYAEGLTSPVTDEAVKTHLADCPECTGILTRMKEPEPDGVSGKDDIDYLRKVRGKNIRRIILSCVSVAALLCATLFVRYYVIGTEIPAEQVECSFETDGDTLAVECEMKNGRGSLTRVLFSEEDGEVSLSFRGSPSAFPNGGRRVRKSYTAFAGIKRVTADGLILWERGIKISEKAARLYNAKTPYVGDICTDTEIAAIAGVPQEIGSFVNELHTSSEPYSWTIIPSKVFRTEDRDMLRGFMKKEACILLAAIGNLDSVKYRYYTYDGPEEFEYSAADADKYLERPVKDYAASAADIQCLLEEIEIGEQPETA